jgi:hypothetical protein
MTVSIITTAAAANTAIAFIPLAPYQQKLESQTLMEYESVDRSVNDKTPVGSKLPILSKWEI